MSAVDAICNVLCHSGYESTTLYGDLARRILHALADAGYAVVELPAPDSTRYEGDEHEPADRLCWLPGDDFEVSVWHPGEVQRCGYGWGDNEPLSAGEARGIALRLLAAADAADKETP